MVVIHRKHCNPLEKKMEGKKKKKEKNARVFSKTQKTFPKIRVYIKKYLYFLFNFYNKRINVKTNYTVTKVFLFFYFFFLRTI